MPILKIKLNKGINKTANPTCGGHSARSSPRHRQPSGGNAAPGVRRALQTSPAGPGGGLQVEPPRPPASLLAPGGGGALPRLESAAPARCGAGSRRRAAQQGTRCLCSLAAAAAPPATGNGRTQPAFHFWETFGQEKGTRQGWQWWRPRGWDEEEAPRICGITSAKTKPPAATTAVTTSGLP